MFFPNAEIGAVIWEKGREAEKSLHDFSPGALPDQRIEPRSPALQADSLPSEDIDRWVPWVPQTGHVAPYSILLLLCVTGKLWVQPKSYLGI